MISLIGRASLGYSDATGPESVIVKLSSQVPELVDMAGRSARGIVAQLDTVGLTKETAQLYDDVFFFKAT